jgi:hypothetical protein
MDTMGPLGQARSTMGPLGQARSTMDTMGPLGQARHTMDIGRKVYLKCALQFEISNANT